MKPPDLNEKIDLSIWERSQIARFAMLFMQADSEGLSQQEIIIPPELFIPFFMVIASGLEALCSEDIK